MRKVFISWALGSALCAMAAGQTPPPTVPEAPGKDTVQRVCGGCHSASIVLGRGMSREQWSEVVANMIAKGAKGTPVEFSVVIDYLAKNFPPKTSGATVVTARRGGGGGFAMGPDNKQVVEAAAAERGKTFFGSHCGACHGPLARGGSGGADLVRSVTLLHDRYGSTLGPFLRSSHPAAAGQRFTSLTQIQIEDLSHFLHQAIADTLRSGPYTKVLDVLTGDPKAGEAYFNGQGDCSKCHSVTGDLARLASRFDAPAMQQRFLFPRTVSFQGGQPVPPKPVSVIVSAGGDSTTGTLVRMDDFTISLRDAAGDYHSWRRDPQVQIEKRDPHAQHDALLDQYTDKNIHDVVAYLETLK